MRFKAAVGKTNVTHLHRLAGDKLSWRGALEPGVFWGARPHGHEWLWGPTGIASEAILTYRKCGRDCLAVGSKKCRVVLGWDRNPIRDCKIHAPAREP